MKKLLWVGDACVSSGFARVTHNILDTLRYSFDISVLGLCYTGDPHDYPYKVYPAYSGGDAFGIGRMKFLAEALEPDVIVIMQDPWNFPQYLDELTDFKGPVIGHVAVDGKNCEGKKLNGLASAVFWTEFGAREAKLGGYKGDSRVIPLGVDREIYKPMDRASLKASILGSVLLSHNLPSDSFVIGVVGRNQQRKRLDLTIQYFAEWVKEQKIDDACLWCHVAPTGEQAYNLHELVKYYGVAGKVFAPTINPVYGLPQTSLGKIYNLFDLLFSTTQGEGFGLTALEAMACGIGCVLPDWSGYGDWAKEGAALIPCTSTAITPSIGGAVVGGLMDKIEAIEVLDEAYTHKAYQQTLGEKAFQLASNKRFDWVEIGEAWLKLLSEVLGEGRGRDGRDAQKDCVEVS